MNWTEDHKLTLKRAIEVMRTDGICFHSFGRDLLGREVARFNVATEAVAVCTVGALEKVRARYGLPRDMFNALARRLHRLSDAANLLGQIGGVLGIANWHDGHEGDPDLLLVELEALLED